MPRTIPVNVQTHLDTDYQTLAFCVKLTRADSTVMGFTSHDKDLSFGGVTYEAASALDATAVRSSIGTGSTDNFEMMGLLQSDKIDADDLRSGLYDGAEIIGSLVNWASVGDGAIVLLKGHIGNITIKDDIFTCEFRSLSQAFNNQIVEVTTPLCRVAKLGDARCGITLGDYQFPEEVEAVTDSHELKFSDDEVVTAGYYTYGRIIWLTGDNAGFVTAIKEHTLDSGNVLSLQEAPPYPVQVGDTATLEAGCDRRIETCAARFSNAVNFRGEPYLPGNSTVMTSARS